jgi:hypothetical protein
MILPTNSILKQTIDVARKTKYLPQVTASMDIGVDP